MFFCKCFNISLHNASIPSNFFTLGKEDVSSESSCDVFSALNCCKLSLQVSDSELRMISV